MNSCLISLFDTRKAAEDWATKRYKEDGIVEEAKVYEIDTAKLGRATMFKVSHLVEALELTASDKVKAQYMILGHIPGEAIEEVTSIRSKLEEGKFLPTVSTFYP